MPKNDQMKSHSANGGTFAIQLFECTLVAVFFVLSFVLAGKMIYNQAFPFGWISGGLLYVMMASMSIIMLGANKYFSFISRPFTETAAKTFSLVIMLNFIYIALLYFSRSIQLSLYYFIITDTLQVLFLLMIKKITFVMKTNIFKNRVSLVVGKNREKNQLLRELKRKTVGRLAFAAYDDEKLREYVDQAHNVFVSGILSKKLKDQIISYCILKDKRVFIVPETYEIAMRKAEMTQVGDIPLFAIESLRLTEAQSIVKRFIDILLAVTGILLSSPLMLYAAIRIKLEDGGPVFYKQTRSGLNGKQFNLIKFRSMIVDAERNTGAVFAQENDPRITRTGRLIRATRIDETPQFFNVLAGSMSMIGPRPERPQFVEEFSKELPEYAGRLAVKPGITGLAQVLANYTTTPENKAKFDLVYIRDYSLMLDLKILFKTVKVVFTKSQSNGFSDINTESDFLLGEKTEDRARNTKSYRTHRIGKALLALSCSMIIILGCMVLRYGALTAAMMEAAMQSASEQGTIQTVFTDAEAVAAENMYQVPPTGMDAPAVEQEAAASDNEPSGTIPKETATAAGSSDAATSDKANVASPIKKETMNYQNNPNQKVVLSQAEINTAIDKMSMGEKMSVAYDLISRLSAEDLMILDRLSEGGFTAKEKKEAKEIMYQYYDDTEVEYIKKLYWEYME